MPLSEIHPIAKGKHDLNQSRVTSCSSNLASPPENEFVELLWKDGQIVMQSQSIRARTNPNTSLDFDISRAHDEDGGDHITPTVRRCDGTLGPSLNELSPSGRVGLPHEDDAVPWLDYPGVQTDMASVHTRPISAEHGVVPLDRNRSYGPMVRAAQLDSTNRSDLVQGSASKTIPGDTVSQIRTSRLFSSTQTSVPNLKSKLWDAMIDCKGTPRSPCSNSGQTVAPGSSPVPAGVMIEKLDARPPKSRNSASLMNFSHFSRPAAIIKAHLQSIDTLKSVANASCKKPNEPSPVIELSGAGSTERHMEQAVASPAKVDAWDSRAKPSQELASRDESEATCPDDLSKHNKIRPTDQIPSQDSGFEANAATTRAADVKVSEPMVASSSVCSGGISVGAASSGFQHGLKRRAHEVESDYQSEDVEDDLIDTRKPTGSRSTNGKRSRAAEVHNLSERRRRDRINEKMRALQELIPNCNKVDKASMLDEAIEYLKTLQLQLQIMSVGAGLCMPPVIVPAGMPPLHPPHIPRFSPVGVGTGMGMGVGLGMGMLDMARPPGFPLIPITHMHGSQFFGPPNLHHVPGSSFQMFGLPGQGFPTSGPHASLSPVSGYMTNVAPAPGVSRSSSLLATESSAPSPGSKELTQTVSVQTVSSMNGGCSPVPVSSKTTRECPEQSDVLQGSNQISHASGSGAVRRNAIS